MIHFTQSFPISNAADDPSAYARVYEAISAESSSGASGYYKLPFDTNALALAQRYAKNPALKPISDLVIIGVGGSSLGARAIDSALSMSANRNAISLHFLEHTDPSIMQQTLESIHIDSTLFLLISKSGSTIESSSLAKYLIARFDLLSKARKAQLACITDFGSPLECFARAHDLACFCIPANVGGRFSVLSLVGLIPLALLGYDIAKLLSGARWMMEEFFAKRAEHIVGKALFLATNAKSLPISVLFSYGSEFKEFNDWFVQLWGESLGKVNHSGEYVGLTPVGLVGSIDQHSFLQLIIQGARDKFVSFLSLGDSRVLDFTIPDLSLEALESTNFVNGTSFLRLLHLQKRATLESLESAGIALDSIVLDSLDEWHIGALVGYFELLTSCVGFLLEVNTYDQPGVEFGKQRLRGYFGGESGF